MACASDHTLFFLILLLAGFCDATDHNILDFAMARKHELWMAEHGRVYKDEIEKARRLEVFKKNLEHIEDFNRAGGHSYTLGVNQFADLTSEEFAASHKGCERLEMEFEEFEELAPMTRSFKYETLEEPLNVSAPSVDWRSKGAVTSVKNQGDCDGCWAMAVVASVESLVKIKKGVLRDLSEQQIIDCNKMGDGCKKGGARVDAFNYIVGNKGLTTRANYPYTATDGKCNKKKEKEVLKNTAISGYKRISAKTERALMLAVTEQPVTVGVDFPKNDQFYKKGIFDGPCGTEPNHAVTVVGYGVQGSTKYWIVKNSYGPGWGEQGYIRIKRLDDEKRPEGLCAIASRGVYPTMGK